MIKKTLKTLTGSLTVSIPENLHELSLKQLIAMQASANLNDLEAIHILSGVALNELQQIKDYNDLHIFNEQVLALANQIRELYASTTIPDVVKFMVNNAPKKIKVIKNLSVEPAGAFMAAREIIAEEIKKHIDKHGESNWQQTFNPSLQACSQILAYYFYTRVTGLPYDEEPASAFVAEVEKLPVAQALPIARYFFLNFQSLSKPKTGFWHRLHRFWNKRLALRSSRNLNTSIPLTHSQVAI